MTIPAYEELLATTSITHLTSTAALEFLGALVDLAELRGDQAGTQHALTLAAALSIATWPSVDRASYYYTIANAWDDLRKQTATTLPQAWNWTNEAFDESLLNLRRARNEPDFELITPERRCQILTNLGSSLSRGG